MSLFNLLSIFVCLSAVVHANYNDQLMHNSPRSQSRNKEENLGEIFVSYGSNPTKCPGHGINNAGICADESDFRCDDFAYYAGGHAAGYGRGVTYSECCPDKCSSGCVDKKLYNGEPWYGYAGKTHTCAWYAKDTSYCTSTVNAGQYIMMNHGYTPSQACCACQPKIVCYTHRHGSFCRSCALNPTQNDECVACNPGYLLKDKKCHAYSCSTSSSGSSCRSCISQSKRTKSNHCYTCNPGYYTSSGNCYAKPTQNGGWSSWLTCTKNCGTGQQTRSCNNPAPVGGADCVGLGSRTCNTHHCQRNCAKQIPHVDAGYEDVYRGWYDVSKCGKCNDYCRWVGGNGSGGDPKKLVYGTSFWSCRLAGTTNPHTPKNHFSVWKYTKCIDKEAKSSQSRNMEENLGESSSTSNEISVSSSTSNEILVSSSTSNEISVTERNCAKQTPHVDAGFEDVYRGWYDVSGCGKCNDYCRWVGGSGTGGDPSKELLAHGTSYWSCRLAGTTNPHTPKNHFSGWTYPKCGVWSDWTGCSKECGEGTISRTCIGGSHCPGTASLTCMDAKCGVWSDWTGCSKECGEGTISRTCIGGSHCPGTASLACMDAPCDIKVDRPTGTQRTCKWCNLSGCYPDNGQTCGCRRRSKSAGYVSRRRSKADFATSDKYTCDESFVVGNQHGYLRYLKNIQACVEHSTVPIKTLCLCGSERKLCGRGANFITTEPIEYCYGGQCLKDSDTCACYGSCPCESGTPGKYRHGICQCNGECDVPHGKVHQNGDSKGCCISSHIYHNNCTGSPESRLSHALKRTESKIAYRLH